LEPEFPRFLNEHIETMPRDQLRQLQEHRLLDVLDYGYTHSPLIEQLWRGAGVTPAEICSLEDFYEKAPFFDKDSIRHFRDVHNDPLGGLARMSHLDLNKVVSTSGTTGDPTPVPIRLRGSSQEGYARDFWEIGVRPGDYGIVSSFTFRIGIGDSPITEVGMIPIPFAHDPRQIPRMAAAIEAFRPTVFSLMSTPMLLGFEQWFKRSGADPVALFSSLQGAIAGGEAMSPRLRALAGSWDLELFETTSLGDVMSGTECRAHAGFHAYEDMVIAECLDPDGDEPVADGELGELVVTTLRNPELPFIRFRTDDLVVMDREPCACGRTHARYQVRGRKGDQILVQGKPILPLDIRFIVEAEVETSGGLFQIIRSAPEMDRLRLRVGYDPDTLAGPAGELVARLEHLVGVAIEVPVQVDLTPNAELLKLGPPHKIPRVSKT
jgi:phenylacetate-CoA ligase